MTNLYYDYLRLCRAERLAKKRFRDLVLLWAILGFVLGLDVSILFLAKHLWLVYYPH